MDNSEVDRQLLMMIRELTEIAARQNERLDQLARHVQTQTSWWCKLTGVSEDTNESARPDSETLTRMQAEISELNRLFGLEG